MPDIPSNEPTELRAGDTWKWNRADMASAYPSPTWTLTYRFKNQNGGFEIVATADGAGGFSVSVPKATTGAIAAGDYAWQGEVDNGTERYTLERGGNLKVVADFFSGSAATAMDQRSHARKVLQAIEAVIEGRASKDQEEYTIGGRSLKRTPIPELLQLRQTYRSEVAGEEAAAALENGTGIGRKIQVRF